MKCMIIAMPRKTGPGLTFRDPSTSNGLSLCQSGTPALSILIIKVVQNAEIHVPEDWVGIWRVVLKHHRGAGRAIVRTRNYETETHGSFFGSCVELQIQMFKPHVSILAVLPSLWRETTYITNSNLRQVKKWAAFQQTSNTNTSCTRTGPPNNHYSNTFPYRIS